MKDTTAESEDDTQEERGPVDCRTSPHLHSEKASEMLHDHNYGKTHPSPELNSEQFFLQRFQFEPEVILFYTGFKDYGSLKAFFLALQPTPETIWKWSHAVKLNAPENAAHAGLQAQHLCLFDQLFLFLCSVRRGFLPFDVSKQFQVSEVTVQTTCVTWCHYLFFMLGTLPIWPSRRTVDELMPLIFRRTFPKTRVVLDFIEISVQMAPWTANASQHRGSTALKSVVGITPSGSISLISSVYAASISDKDIVMKSGVLNLLEPGDEVMAAKSLEIKDLLDAIAAHLVIPPFSRPNRQFSQDSATHTPHADLLKVHIDKALGRIKEFHILDDVPAALSGSVHQLLTVCALLANFQGPLPS
ncbi:uncharacterized protein [Chaetodon trifascialis]|uniref:uncharacterized protein n=1 Tax=Chaetodon trifascialis TaxID=109706 RepID=UPI003991C2D7